MTKLHPETEGNQDLTSPEEAEALLKEIGFFENAWVGIQLGGLWGSKIGTHQIRALIVIAKGGEPRLLEEVYQEIKDQDKQPKA